MQYISKGEDTMLLTDENEVITLRRAVSLKAMMLLEDVRCAEQCEKNSYGKDVTKEMLSMDIRVLNALSNALIACNDYKPN